MDNVVSIKKGRGRREARIPDEIAPRRIEAASILVNPESDEKARILFEVPAWLKDLLVKSAPEGTTTKTCLLHALKELGYPITKEDLLRMRGDAE